MRSIYSSRGKAGSLQHRVVGQRDGIAVEQDIALGEESVTLDFADAEITKNDESIELSDLAESDILFNGYTITLADGTVLK